MNYCVTSVMIPDYTISGTAALLEELGYTAIEWRVRYHAGSSPDESPSFWGRHLTDIDPDNLEKKAPEIRRICEDHGITSLALAPRATAADEDECKKLFAGAESLNCPMVRIAASRDADASYPDQIKQAVDQYQRCIEWAAPHGVKIIQEIHTNTVAVSCEQAYLIASQLPADHFGVIYDSNNMSHQGFCLPYRHGIELLGEYLVHTHIGNRTWAFQGLRDDGSVEWGIQWAALDEGVHHLPDIIRSLKQAGYDGALSLEDFRPGDTKKKLEAGIRILKAAWESA